jgi:hypothetical protein
MTLGIERRTRTGMFLVAFILFVIAASRIIRLGGVGMDTDEVWSVWQTLGTPSQIVAWSPFDWPPLFYLLLGGWRSLVGLQPLSLHLFSIFAFLLSCAATFRLGSKLYGTHAGLIALVVYAGLGYTIYLSMLVRGYVLILLLMPLTLWVALRYLNRPSLRRAMLLSIMLSSMFYVHTTAIAAMAMVGLITLILVPYSIRQWMLPALITCGTILPELAHKASLILGLFGSRASRPDTHWLPLNEYLVELTRTFGGHGAFAWILVFVIATITLLTQLPLQRRMAALALWILAPVGLYAVAPLTAIYSARHIDWVMIGVALWIGWGLSVLLHAAPKLAPVQVIGIGLLAVPMFLPIPSEYMLASPPLGTYLKELKYWLRPGDVVLLDPNCDTATPAEWEYYTRAYFPEGLPFVTHPQTYRRVWYVTREGSHTSSIDAAVTGQRIAGKYFGPWNLLFRLYEGPPDVEGILFENGMRFHGADVIENNTIKPGPLARHEGESIHLRLWWTIAQSVPLDYSISLRVVEEKSKLLVAQQDGPPRMIDAPPETSRWIPGHYYVEDRQADLPYPLRKGSYGIYLTVYQWWDRKRMTAPGTTADNLLPIKPLWVEALSLGR